MSKVKQALNNSEQAITAMWKQVQELIYATNQLEQVLASEYFTIKLTMLTKELEDIEDKIAEIKKTYNR